MNKNAAIRTVEGQYACTFRPEREGGYTVRCNAFPELITHGKTLEDARRNAREALQLCLEVYLEKDWPLPATDAAPQRTIRELVPVHFPAG